MSQWTHVNASFRLDSLGKIDDKRIIDVFGKQVNYESMGDLEYDDVCEVRNKEEYLPMGSEGTLEMSIWHNPDKCCIASTTVLVVGDLRDFNSFKEIKEWFERCCKEFCIRQAVCQVDIEGVGGKLFYYDDINRNVNTMDLWSTDEMKVETLKDTVELMNSDDYRDRFIAEYKQLVIRYKGLKNMVDKWDNGELSFDPTCPRSTYNLQLRAMEDYIAVLEARAKMENIIL